MSEAVRLERRGAVALLTFNLPEKRNAMTAELTAAFAARLGEVRTAPDVNVLVLTGQGQAFCAGGDLAMLQRMAGRDPEANRREMGAFYRLYLGLVELDIPTIAAINGAAVGAGLSVALACDLRLCAVGARLAVSFLNLGLHPGMATTHLLPLLVGHARAAELCFTGRAITADEALAIGLVNRVLPPEELLPAALALANEIAAKPAAATRMTKRALARPILQGLEAALDYEAMAQAHSYASPELRERVARMLERDRPRGSGPPTSGGDGG